MRFLKLSLILLALNASANEHGGGGGGGEGAAPTTSKDQREYAEKSAKLNSLINKIGESEKTFQELVHHKNESKSTTEKQAIIQEMVTLTQQRNKDVDAYNKLKSDLELRYPNQGQELNRVYETQSKRSVEELEGVAGLDELLTRTKKVVEKKYAPFMVDAPKAGAKKEAAHAPGEDEPKRLRLEK